MALTCCDFQKAQTSELLKILIPRSRFAGPAGRGQVRAANRSPCITLADACGMHRRQSIQTMPSQCLEPPIPAFALTPLRRIIATALSVWVTSLTP